MVAHLAALIFDGLDVRTDSEDTQRPTRSRPRPFHQRGTAGTWAENTPCRRGPDLVVRYPQQASANPTLRPATASQQNPVGVVCAIVDLNSTGDHVHLYVADTSSFDGNIPAFVSGAETIHIKGTANPGLLCAAEGSFSFYTLPHASFTTISRRSSQQANEVPIGTNAQRRTFGIR